MFEQWMCVENNQRLTAACIFLNSFLLVPSGTNWFALSTRMGVFFEGEPSATHCNRSRGDSR